MVCCNIWCIDEVLGFMFNLCREFISMGVSPHLGVPQHVVGIQITYDDAPVGEGEGYEDAGDCVELRGIVVFIIYI
jgi:hypothetical protein